MALLSKEELKDLRRIKVRVNTKGARPGLIDKFKMECQRKKR